MNTREFILQELKDGELLNVPRLYARAWMRGVYTSRRQVIRQVGKLLQLKQIEQVEMCNGRSFRIAADPPEGTI